MGQDNEQMNTSIDIMDECVKAFQNLNLHGFEPHHSKILKLFRNQLFHLDTLGPSAKDDRFAAINLDDGEQTTATLKPTQLKEFRRLRDLYYEQVSALDEELSPGDHEQACIDLSQPIMKFCNTLRASDFHTSTAKKGTSVLRRLDEPHFGTAGINKARGRMVLFIYFRHERAQKQGYEPHIQFYSTQEDNGCCRDVDASDLCQDCKDKREAQKHWNEQGVARDAAYPDARTTDYQLPTSSLTFT